MCLNSPTWLIWPSVAIFIFFSTVILSQGGWGIVEKVDLETSLCDLKPQIGQFTLLETFFLLFYLSTGQQNRRKSCSRVLLIGLEASNLTIWISGAINFLIFYICNGWGRGGSILYQKPLHTKPPPPPFINYQVIFLGSYCVCEFGIFVTFVVFNPFFRFFHLFPFEGKIVYGLLIHMVFVANCVVFCKYTVSL